MMWIMSRMFVMKYNCLYTYTFGVIKILVMRGKLSKDKKINSLLPRDAIWRHVAWSSLVEVMACRQFGAQLLP